MPHFIDASLSRRWLKYRRSGTERCDEAASGSSRMRLSSRRSVEKHHGALTEQCFTGLNGPHRILDLIAPKVEVLDDQGRRDFAERPIPLRLASGPIAWNATGVMWRC